jgi:cardiolipin synthase A/B
MSEAPGAGKGLTRKVRHHYGVSDPQFRREMSVMLGPSIASGNRITALHNGDEIFPPMLEAIRGARVSINFETYVYWSGEIGREFADAFSERAGAGVAVHVILDWAGSVQMDRAVLTQMEDAGAKVHRYRPLRWYDLSRLNNRTHRKILVVDGRVGFTGGSGSPISGRGGPRIQSTGGTSISAWRGPWWPSSSRPSTTTGSRRRVRS